MNVVFFGTPDFAVPCLEMLISEGYNIPLVVTQPDRKCGRGQKVMPTPVKECAIKYSIPVIQPDTLKDEAILPDLEKAEPELIVVVAYGKILPSYILDFPKLGCINVHASLLPKLRGAAPIQWSVINGEKETGVTTMLMDKGLDTGDMLYKATVPIEEEDTGGSMFEKLKVLGAELLKTTVVKLKDGKAVRLRQNHDESTYAPMISKSDALIDWSDDYRRIVCKIKGMNPAPGAYTTLNDKKVKIYFAREGEPCEDTEYGKVWGYIPEKGLGVVADGGLVYITELQMENSKRMPVSEFLRGRKIEPGERFV